MSVKYVKGPGGKFRGSLPSSKATNPAKPFTGVVEPQDELTDGIGALHSLDDAWTAFERTKTSGGEADPVATARQALRDYHERAAAATSQDDLYEAQDIYLQEIDSIPLGRVDADLSHAWAAYRSLGDLEETSAPTPSREPHGWLLAVAMHGRDPKALEQVWHASDILARTAENEDPRLETVANARLYLLEMNPHTPRSVFEDAYSAERLDAMRDTPESDYALHLVRLPVGAVSLSHTTKEDIARRIGEWAQESKENAEDIDDAAEEANGSKLIPVFLSGIDRRVIAPFKDSPSRAVAASVNAAEEGYGLLPRKV